jgi:glutathione peroxidase
MAMFPSNTFYQEPKDGPEILTHLKEKLEPQFPNFQLNPHMTFFGKVSVNGEETHDLYKFMKSACPRASMPWDLTSKENRDIQWNYEKFLVDKNGKPRFRFAPHGWNKGEVVKPFIDHLLTEGTDTTTRGPRRKSNRRGRKG